MRFFLSYHNHTQDGLKHSISMSMNFFIKPQHRNCICVVRTKYVKEFFFIKPQQNGNVGELSLKNVNELLLSKHNIYCAFSLK